MTPTIFYSWQSDRPNRVNRGLIERALQAATKGLKKQATTFLPPRVDSDVKGTTGAQKINDTIFRKIDGCSAFIADVTLLPASQEAKRITPNPNVLVELGYAAKAIGWDRVILVLNTAYGKPEDLPFDLRGRTTLTYCASETEQDLKTVRAQLQRDCEKVLRSMLAKPFSHCGTICFLDDTMSLEISAPPTQDDQSPEAFEKRVVLLPLALKGAPGRTLTNIDCYLDFPEGLDPKDKCGVQFAQKWAQSPTTETLIDNIFPKKSSNPMAEVVEEIRWGLCIQRPLAEIKPEHCSPEKAKQTIDGHQVRVHIKKLKANLVHALPELFVIVDPENVEFPTVIQCRITTDKGESIGQLTVGATEKAQSKRGTTTASNATS